MTALLVWAGVSVGVMIGFPVGWLYCWPRAHADGVTIGRQDAERWREYLRTTAPEYARGLPHGSPGHIHSTHCS